MKCLLGKKETGVIAKLQAADNQKQKQNIGICKNTLLQTAKSSMQKQMQRPSTLTFIFQNLTIVLYFVDKAKLSKKTITSYVSYVS